MNGILGMLQLLRQSELNPRQPDYVDKAQMAGKSLMGIMSALLHSRAPDPAMKATDIASLEIASNRVTLETLERNIAQAMSSPVATRYEVRSASQMEPLDRLEGLHLLVVDDNALNQQVMFELLTALGAIVSLAENGLLGVDAVLRANPPFDAVLMDIQMPIMDG